MVALMYDNTDTVMMHRRCRMRRAELDKTYGRRADTKQSTAGRTLGLATAAAAIGLGGAAAVALHRRASKSQRGWVNADATDAVDDEAVARDESSHSECMQGMQVVAELLDLHLEHNPLDDLSKRNVVLPSLCDNVRNNTHPSTGDAPLNLQANTTRYVHEAALKLKPFTGPTRVDAWLQWFRSDAVRDELDTILWRAVPKGWWASLTARQPTHVSREATRPMHVAPDMLALGRHAFIAGRALSHFFVGATHSPLVVAALASATGPWSKVDVDAVYTMLNNKLRANSASAYRRTMVPPSLSLQHEAVAERLFHSRLSALPDMVCRRDFQDVWGTIAWPPGIAESLDIHLFEAEANTTINALCLFLTLQAKCAETLVRR